MIGQYLLLFCKNLFLLNKFNYTRRRLQVGRDCAGDTPRLRQRGTAQPRATVREVHQQQHRVAAIGTQLRRQRLPCINHRRKCRDNQRQGCDDFFLFTALAPRRLHRQRILAHRNADAKFRAQFHRHCVHRIEQRRILATVTRRRHPVGREFDIAYMRYGCGGNIGQRFAHCHTARRLRIDHRQRRTLAHRKRLSTIGIKAHQRHRNIRHRHLPRPYHLIARGHAAHAAVADADQKRFVRNRRHAQHAIRCFAQIKFSEIKCRQLTCNTCNPPRHLRWLAEQYRQLHVHRVIRKLRIMHGEPTVIRGLAHHGIGAALAHAYSVKSRQ